MLALSLHISNCGKHADLSLWEEVCIALTLQT